jgi:glycosyltransferase involved in cell wall biosynthesis
MRIMLHGAHPDLPTGYAMVMRTFIPRLLAAGHQVAVSALAGTTSHMATWQASYNGETYQVPVYPCTPYEPYGQDVVHGHYLDFKADLCITMTCSWVFDPMAWRDMRVIHITPVDIEGMSAVDYHVIANSGGTPAAVCRWGEKQMRGRGLDPVYLPHGTDTAAFRPPADRAALRRGQGLDHMFVVGMNFSNHERERKAAPEQMEAFAKFHVKHPQSVLLMHTIAFLPEGLKLPVIAAELGISKAIVWSNQYQLATGTVREPDLAAWYGTCDVLLNATCGEGFGLPTLEAQACGTPVITSSWSASQEIGKVGWQVKGQRRWNNHHQKFWQVPLVPSLVQALDKAHKHSGEMRGQAREFAMTWDADRVFAEHWVPLLDELG